MRVLLISPTESGIGGIAQHVQGLKQFLTTQNHNVNIISSENTFTLPIKGLKNPSFMISSFFKTKLMKKNDIVHAHNIPSALAMKNTNGKKVNNPSYLVKESDSIEVRDKSKELTIIAGSLVNKEREIPDYIQMDEKNKKAKLIRVPKFSEVPYPTIMEPNLVIEYYSR